MVNQKDNVILIVDDNPNNLKLLFDFLKESGFKVLVAKDGESAIEKLQEVSPNIILLDVMMPGIDGFETCYRLKASVATKDIPVIFMTALTDRVDKVKGLSMGAVDYITKPFQQEEVLARVQLHLRLRNLTKTLEEQNVLLKKEIEGRKEAEAALQKLTSELEERVASQTAELRQAYNELQQAQVQLLQREEKLGHDAFHDALTDLPNRAWFMNRLQQAIDLSYRHEDYLYAVLFIDLDRFKVVNDSLGHLVGDQLLKSIAHQLQVCLRHTDAVARFGGDEFVILLEDIKDIDEPNRVAERIQNQLRQPFNLNDYEVFTDISIGIIVSTMGYDRPEDVLRDADIAMYYAKAQGRGRYETFDPAMQTVAMTRLQLENDLRRAMALQEFCVHYQPIVSLSTGQLSGFEALVRWHHPSGTIYPPAEFIPVAEETGLINELGWWVLQEACHQIGIWQQQFPQTPPLAINVNLSPVQLKQANLLNRIEEILQQTGFPNYRLKLEITESCILETVSREEKMLKQLKALGILLCIDDFGTGYSSLSRLHEFPIDTLKIDRSFVSRIGLDNSGVEIIQTIVTLARSRGMDIVAEGIETPTQLQKLRELGCELGQGYLFSKPVDSEKATELLGIKVAVVSSPDI
ncbi:response regulator receiver modulated diguanylate cyclase/phosphodiesterase [Oscillatoria nigro-viridis PCC 7112]|uniref:Response regulator receiver modulated diguanylate cyclase/phosphodiesterase n=1 Tax=Phormidium nigroviride PCC 7112 TaxID=179408 RepID=K9VHQ4_9CYAN|nr:EAL domain-containing response regulator [Oscillatoria nigro-viridis]AFZ06775.1 response regulator receiver modulated diguanylate cyclase/phosphodiesterase [Oscillatoria nigro-viridis PCC 7112]